MIRILTGDALEVLRALPDASVHSVVTDPPYPEVDRPYGRWTEAEWHELMHAVIAEVRRVLVPTGSAMFVLQPNSEQIGRVRPWLWDFLAWASREVGIVQDAYWWNHGTIPHAGCERKHGLMRGSVKYLAWLGDPGCYRDQGAVLWSESDLTKARRRSYQARLDGGGEARIMKPSGHGCNVSRVFRASQERGGVTPFNLLPLPNTRLAGSGDAKGHPASTPIKLCRWWVRYITPPGGVVLDPFAGSGSVAIACLREGRSCISIEREHSYVRIARERVRAEAPLFHPDSEENVSEMQSIDPLFHDVPVRGIS